MVLQAGKSKIMVLAYSKSAGNLLSGSQMAFFLTVSSYDRKSAKSSLESHL
jgi:hypothetical protein